MRELLYPFDAAMLQKKKRSIRRALLEDGRSRIRKNIAVLGGSTTDEIIKMLDLFLLNEGIEASFYECEYAQFEQEALFPGEELLSFAPDCIILHTSMRNIRNLPAVTDSAEEVAAKYDAECARWKAVWDALRERFRCPVIQNNFEMPFYRILGNHDCTDPRGARHFISRMNAFLAGYAAEADGFYVHDLEYCAADYGLREWASPSYWNLYKYCLAIPAVPYYAYSLSHVVKAIFGKNRKVLSLDLDNTLWGGVVGDDGVEGIEIGQENGVAQSYHEFQNYVKQLGKTGVILTVCSKNDEENALDGLRHPEGALRPEDFALIRANWENKDRNLVETADTLSLLPEAIVFADDNPAEREIAAAQVPEIAVPAMDGVENYIAVIDRNGFFETISLSEDDLKRGAMYKENAQRTAARQAFADYGEYLTSLQMQAEIVPFPDIYLSRITQLTNKSNQFNVTTRRYTLPEIEDIAGDPAYVTLCGKLIDKFGDNGVVSVVIGHKDGDVLHMDLWLMSCRVLKRDMEFAMLDTLVGRAAEAGIRTIRGYYYPTKKNGMVRELYGAFGFTKVSEDGEGNTVWELPVEGYQKQNRYIAVNENA